MQIKRDWPISFDAERFVAVQGESLGRLLQNPARLEAFHQALEEVQAAVQPAACWDRFPVQRLTHEKVVLADGTRLGGGPVVMVVGGAEELVVAVCTVGHGVDRLVEAAQREQQLFKAMLLSDLGSWGVDQVRQGLCRWLEVEAQRQGRRVSAPLSPGESDWAVTDQASIFALLDAAQINVWLSPSMVMSPIKSLSMIMGVGSRPMGVEGASNCDFCSLQERCRYRTLRVA